MRDPAGQAATPPMTPSRLLARLIETPGWKRRGVAFAAGICAALAQAPFYLLPLMAAGYAVFLLLTDAARREACPARAGFSLGWFFGFGYFVLGLYWLGNAFLVQAEEFAWMIPFVLTAFPAFLALFFAGAGAAVAKLKIEGPLRIFPAAAALMVFEYLRGHILTGLPWNLPAQALAGTAAGAQTAAWWGAYGLSLVALILAMTPAAFATAGKQGFVKGAVLSVVGIAALFMIGFVRLWTAGAHEVPDVFVRIVQPDIPQREKIDGDLWQRNYERQISMSAAPGPATGTLFIVWPENAVPVIDEVQSGLDALHKALPANAILLAGAVRREIDAKGGERFFNSFSVIEDKDGARLPVAHYDKHHLVPFGEYLPLQGLLRAVGLAQLAPYDDGFTAGPGPRAIRLDGVPAFSPIICYEAIFPGAIYPKGDRPDFIVNVTNDGWFGDSSGPRQHLDQARLRVIETGLPMARSANTGVSALFDAAGRLNSTVGLYKAGVIDAPLPKALPPTLYDRIGDLFFLVLLIASGIGGYFAARASR
ncbi:MAG: apolipoprotein N-acyltransferase [Parvularculaceae bacterium]